MNGLTELLTILYEPTAAVPSPSDFPSTFLISVVIEKAMAFDYTADI